MSSVPSLECCQVNTAENSRWIAFCTTVDLSLRDSQVEQRLKTLNPDAAPEKQRIYSYRVLDRKSFTLSLDHNGNQRSRVGGTSSREILGRRDQNQDPLDAESLNTIKAQYSQLMDSANKHDLKARHGMFWQSPSALMVAKSAIPSEGNWAGFWGNDAIDQKLHGIAGSGLALARRIAEEHGGSVCLEESNREKTVFTLSLTKNDY